MLNSLWYLTMFLGNHSGAKPSAKDAISESDRTLSHKATSAILPSKAKAVKPPPPAFLSCVPIVKLDVGVNGDPDEEYPVSEPST